MFEFAVLVLTAAIGLVFALGATRTQLGAFLNGEAILAA